jgi:Ca-activated chloride channel family protein
MTLTVRTDRHLVHANRPDERHLLLELTAPKPRRKRGARKTERPGVNVCFVLDRSGSMAGEKIALARYAVERALNGLTPRDRFSVVAFDDMVETVATSHKATDAAKHQALIGLQQVDARGSTNLHGGWSEGASLVKDHLDEQGVNRVLLLTDGLANRGETEPQTLCGFAADLRASGVTTSTFGVGADFDESLLQTIADAGGGHFYFISHPDQIPDYMTGELGELLDTVARQVVVEIKHAPGLAVQALSPVAAKVGGPGQTALLLGDLVAGQAVELVLTVAFPPAMTTNSQTTVFFTVRDRDAVLKADGCSVDYQAADDAACAAETPDPAVERAVATLKAAQARQMAVASNRMGDFGAATTALGGAVASMSRFADPRSAALVQELLAERAMLSVPATEEVRKAVHYRGSTLARSRDASGFAKRRPTR